jgi:hypothetical protein
LIGLLSGFDDLEVFSVFGLAAEPPQPAMLFHVRSPKKVSRAKIALALRRHGYQRPRPSRIPAAATANELDDEKEYQCADSGVDDGRDDPAPR